MLKTDEKLYGGTKKMWVAVIWIQVVEFVKMGKKIAKNGDIFSSNNLLINKLYQISKGKVSALLVSKEDFPHTKVFPFFQISVSILNSRGDIPFVNLDFKRSCLKATLLIFCITFLFICEPICIFFLFFLSILTSLEKNTVIYSSVLDF